MIAPFYLWDRPCPSLKIAENRIKNLTLQLLEEKKWGRFLFEAAFRIRDECDLINELSHEVKALTFLGDHEKAAKEVVSKMCRVAIGKILHNYFCCQESFTPPIDIQIDLINQWYCRQMDINVFI